MSRCRDIKIPRFVFKELGWGSPKYQDISRSQVLGLGSKISVWVAPSIKIYPDPKYHWISRNRGVKVP